MTADDISACDTVLKAGASGGKLPGDGQGGFLLFTPKPEYHDRIQAALPKMLPLEAMQYESQARRKRVGFLQ